MELSSDEEEHKGPNGLRSYLDEAEDYYYDLTGKDRKLDERFF